MFKKFRFSVVKYTMFLCFVIVFMSVTVSGNEFSNNVPGDYEFSVEHGGEIREYYVYVPQNVEEDAPLVFVFHPFLGTPKSIRGISDFDDKSDEEGFIVVFPAGLSNSWNSLGCCGYAHRNKIDDIGFVEVMIENIKADFSVDNDRIYAVGFSNGGQMAHSLGALMSEDFASIAAVAGARVSLQGHSDLESVSVLHINAIDDDLSTIKLANNTIEWWVEEKECVFFEKILKGQGSYCDLYRCKNNSQVEFCITLEGGHSWPGGTSVRYTPSTAFFATDLIWDFFEEDYKNKNSKDPNYNDFNEEIVSDTNVTSNVSIDINSTENETIDINIIDDTNESIDTNVTDDTNETNENNETETENNILSQVDSNKNNIVEFNEVISYMNEWLAGNVSLNDLIEVINLWRN